MKNMVVIFCCMVAFCPWHTAFAQYKQPEIEFASSPNPVGSGARALGMGGAFIAVADDATAASWNPGGLAQLKTPEISLVGSWFHRIEDNTFGHYSGAGGSESVSEGSINYFSVTYPFNLADRNMVISLNYQHLYNFNRKWHIHNTYADETEEGRMTIDETVDYQLNGGLSALGLAYCIQVLPQFSFGFTLNFWDDDLVTNKWEVRHHASMSGTIELPPDAPVSQIPITSSFQEKLREDAYLFSGFNANMGALCRLSEKLTLGMVVKLPFTADLTHDVTDQNEDMNKKSATKNEKADMPISYGIGLAYRLSDQLTLSADICRTEWQDFIIRDSDGNEISPVTQKPPDKSDVDPTHQVRLGGEYLFVHPPSDTVIPLRAGLFYDPAPAQGSPDDFYGVSFGSGITMGRYIFDVACQYRFGNDVGASMIQYYESFFSQDVHEYMIYSSLIIHF